MANKKSEVETVIEDAKVDETVETAVLDETAASDSLKPGSMPVGAANKAASLGKVVDAFAKFGPETINKFLASLEQIGHEADSISSGAAASNKATINAKEETEVSLDDTVKAVIKEDIAALFEGEDLKEEFKEKVAVLFESAINLKVSAKTLELEEAYETKLNEQLDVIATNLEETLDTYLDYAVETWLTENEVAIESSIKSDLTEQFMEDLKALFETHYISIPEDKVDVLEEMNARIEELEALASEKIEENLALAAKLEEAAVEAIFVESTKDLALSDVEKLTTMVESVEYTSVSDFKNKVDILKESYFAAPVVKKDTSTLLFEEVEKIEEEEVKPSLRGPMAAYVDSIAKNIR